MADIRAVLSDLDGTLTHSDPVHLRAFRHLLTEEWLDMDEPGYREHVSGWSNVEIGQRMFPGRARDVHAALLARKGELLWAYATGLVLTAAAIDLPGAAMGRAMKSALVTNAPRSNVGHMLAAIKAADHFDTSVYGDEMARPKPDPLSYLTGLERLGATASEALAFENSLPGIRTAKAAGIQIVGVASSRTEDELRAAGADCVVVDFMDVRLLPMIGL